MHLNAEHQKLSNFDSQFLQETIPTGLEKGNVTQCKKISSGPPSNHMKERLKIPIK